jgi:hypothetical protein
MNMFQVSEQSAGISVTGKTFPEQQNNISGY